MPATFRLTQLYRETEMKRFITNEKGFTLIEMLVTVVISGIVGLMLVRIFEVNSQVFSGEQKVMNMHANARQGIHEMAKNIRILGYDPELAGSAIFGITAADGTSITFTADTFDEDGVLDANETYSYQQVSATVSCPTTCIESLVLGGGGVTRVIARDISASPAPDNNPAFCLQYTYEDGTQSSADCSDVVNLPDDAVASLAFAEIRKITITVTARTEQAHNLTKQFKYETVNSTVMLRNNIGL